MTIGAAIIITVGFVMLMAGWWLACLYLWVCDIHKNFGRRRKKAWK